MKPLRVLQISQNYYVRGGSDVMFFKNIALLKAHGHEVIPFAAQDPRNEPTEWAQYFPPGADFEHPGPRDVARFIYSVPARKALERIIREYRPQIAHLHIYYGKITASILSLLKNAGIPIVQTLHDYKLICPVYSLLSHGKTCEVCEGKYFWRALPRRCNRGSLSRTALSVAESYVSRMLGSVTAIDRFIAVSQFQRKKMVQYGIRPDKITVIYNWVNTENSTHETQSGNYLLYFGRIEAIKGLFTLLEAIAPLPHINLKIAGAGNASQSIVNYIVGKNLRHVKYLGFQQGTQLEDLIKNSLSVVFPTQAYETFGLTVAEAFGYGKPVIGTRIGAVPELIDDGVNGFLFEAGDVQALRKHMQWMAENPDRALEMGRAGRKKVETSFSAERYYEQLMSVYESVLQRK